MILSRQTDSIAVSQEYDLLNQFHSEYDFLMGSYFEFGVVCHHVTWDCGWRNKSAVPQRGHVDSHCQCPN